MMTKDQKLMAACQYLISSTFSKRRRTTKSVMGASLFLILIVYIQPISLLKLPPQAEKELLHLEKSETTTLPAHYPEHPAPDKALPKDQKTNSFNFSSSSSNIHKDANESGPNRANGRSALSQKTKPTTSPPSLTFDLRPTMSTISQKMSHSEKRRTRSLKNGTIKVTSEKNPKDEYPLWDEGVAKSPQDPAAEAREDDSAAIENFEKTFVNQQDISPSAGVAFPSMGMGILGKFPGEKSLSSGDKKGIQHTEQLSPSELLGDGNNDIKIQDFENLAKMKGSHQLDDIPLARMRDGEEEEETEGNEVVNRKGAQLGEEFDSSIEPAPEGIDSIENSSAFYYSASFNNNNVLEEEEEDRVVNHSSRLPFAGFADFDKAVGVGTSGAGSVGVGGGSDFQQSADFPSETASADEVKLYRIVQRLLKESPLIDGHNDLPWNLRKFIEGQLLEFDFDSDLRTTWPWSQSNWSHTDLPRMRRGLVGAQFWVAYAPCQSQNQDAVQITLEQIDLIHRLIAKYPDSLQLALSADDIEKAHKAGKIASLIAVEGGHSIGNSIGVLRTFYDLGVRYMTLTHTCNTPWADAARPGFKPEHGGLTEFGRTIVREMNRLGMLVDLSHTSQLTMKDALKVSKAPVIFSHSSAFQLCNSSRNVPDDILKELVWSRGIIMVTFFNIYVNCQNNATVKDVTDHINYIRGKIGTEHVGIGSDFDGINLTPLGLEDVSKFPNLFVELLRSSNWSNDELKKVAGKNFLRVFREAENVRDIMQSAGTPLSFEVIPPRELPNNRCRQLDKNDSTTSTVH